MESKRTDRKLNSWFWHILYTLPLLTLSVLFIGYLCFYKTTGNQLIHEDVEKVVDTEVLAPLDYELGVLFYDGGYIEKLYFNTTTILESSDFFNSLESQAILDLFDFIPLFISDNQTLLLSAENNAVGFCYTLIYFDCYFEDATLENRTVLYDGDERGMNGFVGWNPDFDGTLEINDNYNLSVFFGGASLEDVIESESEMFEELGYPTDYHDYTLSSDFVYNRLGYVIEQVPIIFDSYFTIPYGKKYISIFDYSLVQTNETFDSFVIPVLTNGFNDIFEIVGFDCTSFLARFVIILFTWMIQIKFIHIIVDVLSFVPDMYHDFTNGKRC